MGFFPVLPLRVTTMGLPHLRACVWWTPCWAPDLPANPLAQPWHPVKTVFTARQGPRGHCAAQGRGKWGCGEEKHVLELPLYGLKGASPDGSQVTGQGC